MHARVTVSGATSAIARRCVLRKAFLAPWHPMVKEFWLYALAEAQRKLTVELHSTRLVLNHHHTIATPEGKVLPEFMRRVHRDTSCAINTLLAYERYDAPGEVFDDRSAHVMRLMDAPAMMTQLAYDQNNCVAAGLVSRPEHMPDHVFDFDLWKSEGIVVTRPELYFDKTRPSELILTFTPPPLLLREFDGDLDKLIYNMKRLSDHAGQQLRQARRGRAPMGAQAVQRLHPWSEPRTLREKRGQRVPTFRIGARGIDGCIAAACAAAEVKQFRIENRQTRLARKAGDHNAVFPFGTFEQVEFHGAPEQPQCKDTAFVTKPGPLLADVKNELAQERTQHERQAARAQAIAISNDAHLAFEEEAATLVAEDEMHFDSVVSSGDKPPPVTTAERQQAVVQHRFKRANNDPSTAPRRVVTLHDASRGRPRRSNGKDGADRPA